MLPAMWFASNRNDLTAMGKYAHTFVGIFLAMREFLPQGTVSGNHQLITNKTQCCYFSRTLLTHWDLLGLNGHDILLISGGIKLWLKV